MIAKEVLGTVAVATGSATVYDAANKAIPILMNLQHELYKNPVDVVFAVALAATEMAVVGAATGYAAKNLIQGPAHKLNRSMKAFSRDVKRVFRQYRSDCGPLGLLLPAGFPVYYAGIKIAEELSKYSFSRKDKEKEVN
jgi:hypothetical protein